VLDDLRARGIWKCTQCEDVNRARQRPRTSVLNLSQLQSHTPSSDNTRDTIVMQWNCDGIWRKSNELICWLAMHRPDIVMLQETKLLQEDKAPVFKGYNVERLDRMCRRQTASVHRGGGLITLIRDGVLYSRTYAHSSENLEILTIKVHTAENGLYMTNVYAPPIRTTAEDNRNRAVQFNLIPTYENGLVAGDFNAHNRMWDRNAAPDNRGQELVDWMDSNELSTANDGSPTRFPRNNNMPTAPDLTIIHTSQEQLVTWKVKKALGSDHLPIIIKWRKGIPKAKPKPEWSFNYKKAEWGLYARMVKDLMEDVIPENMSVKELYNKWKSRVLMAAYTYIPRKRRRREYVPWMNDRIKAAITRRNEARARYGEDAAEWKEAEDSLRHVIRETKEKIWRSKLAKIQATKDPRMTWNVIKSIRGDAKQQEDKSIIYNGRLCISKRARANAFIHEYAKISQVKSDKEVRLCKVKVIKTTREVKNTPITKAERPFQMHELQTALHDTQVGKAAGPDEVSPEMLKRLPSIATEMLILLFNRCWESGECPQSWREATIVPILKKEKDPANVSSYRPISLTSAVGKLLERMIKNRLAAWMESNNSISQHQAGFRSGRDTTDQCLRLSQCISDGFHAKPTQRTVMAQFDFSKAYDMVWRGKLLEKMFKAGVPTRFITYIKGWLTNRRACVKYQGVHSKKRVFRAGLPQGAVLSPILFLFYINDLLEDFEPETLVCAYADDLALACTNSSKAYAQAVIQRESDKVYNWCKENRMTLNVTKCTISLFSTSSSDADWRSNVKIGDNAVTFEQTPTFLGVKYDRLLHFGAHAQMIIDRVENRNRVLRSLGGTDWGWGRQWLRSVFLALQRSVLEYATAAWYPWMSMSHFSKLESAQLKAARLVTRLVASTPREAVLVEAKLCTLAVRCNNICNKRAVKWITLPEHDNRLTQANREVRLRLKRSDWRSSHVPAAKQAVQQALVNVQARKKMPWDHMTLAKVHITPVSKHQSLEEQRDAAIGTIELAGNTDLEIYTDGSVEGDDKQGGAGIVVFKNGIKYAAWNRYTGAGNCSYDTEKVAIEEALRWLQSHREWTKAKIITDSKSIITQLANPYSGSMATQTINEKLEEILTDEKEVHFIWIPGHCEVLGNDEADQEAERGRISRANVIQPENTTESLQRRMTSGEGSHPVISHERISRVYTRQLRAEENCMNKQDRTNLSRFRTGHHPALRYYQHRIGMADSADCRLCGESTEDMEHLWLHCDALNRVRTISEAGHTLSDLVEKPGMAKQLVRTILARIAE
jgi:ribonuclease HI/endonuclease/exonuclease/phosphatase (EEP) superfamily protein YafD